LCTKFTKTVTALLSNLILAFQEQGFSELNGSDELELKFCFVFHFEWRKVQTHTSLFRRKNIIKKTVRNRKLRQTTTTITSTSPSPTDRKHITSKHQRMSHACVACLTSQ